MGLLVVAIVIASGTLGCVYCVVALERTGPRREAPPHVEEHLHTCVQGLHPVRHFLSDVGRTEHVKVFSSLVSAVSSTSVISRQPAELWEMFHRRRTQRVGFCWDRRLADIQHFGGCVLWILFLCGCGCLSGVGGKAPGLFDGMRDTCRDGLSISSPWDFSRDLSQCVENADKDGEVLLSDVTYWSGLC